MKTTKVFDKLLAALVDPEVRGVASRGGTRSSKTHSMLQLLYMVACESETALLISCVTDTNPGVRRGMFRDFKRILQDAGEWDPNAWHDTRMEYSFENGSMIEFFGCENSSKVFGPSRDILFINEAQRVPKEVFRQLDVRTRFMVFIDFNPVRRFWAHDHFKGEGMVEIVSTYKDNPYLPPEQVAAIEANRGDANWWRIFGEGETGGVEGLIYPDYDIVPEFPADATWCTGLDFGFKGDPAAIIKVGFVGWDLYVSEILYEHGKLNKDLSAALKDNGLHRSITVADNAEQKSITEIAQTGCKIIPCTKGRGSVIAGIGQVKQFNLHIVAGSRNIQNECDSYSYVYDKMTGTFDLSQAVDENNHAMDAIRYAVDFLITKYKPGRSRRNRDEK